MCVMFHYVMFRLPPWLKKIKNVKGRGDTKKKE